jgi:DNA-binding MarR family transcriptional regulator
MPSADRPEAEPDFSLRTPVRIHAGWLAQDLMFLSRSLRFLLRPHSEALRRAAGLEPGEIGILVVVALNPGLSQNELAASVVLRKSAVTKIVQALERRGLLLRARSSADGRAKSLRLTATGEAVVERLRRDSQAFQARWFAGIDPAEQDVFFSVLRRLVARLAEKEPPLTPG